MARFLAKASLPNIGMFLGVLFTHAEALALNARKSTAKEPVRGFTIPNLVRRNGSGISSDSATFTQCMQNLTIRTGPHKKILSDKMYGCQRDFGEVYLEAENPEDLRQFEPQDVLDDLANRRILFAGDSIIFHTWAYMICWLESTGNQHAGGAEATVEDTTVTYGEKSKRFLWFEPKHNITLEWVGGGRNYERQKQQTLSWHVFDGLPYNLAKVLPDLVKDFGPRDVAIINSGNHDNTEEQASDDRDHHGFEHLENIEIGKNKDMSRTQSKTKDATQVAHAVANLVKDLRAKKGNAAPTVIWRESTPQHFAGAVNGQWVEHPRLDHTWMGECAALDPELLEESSDANFRNKLTNPIVDGANVPVLRVWNALATHPESHCGKRQDCTHWNWDVNRIMMQGLLNMFLTNA